MPQSVTSDLNFVTQLSEKFLNKLIGALYDSDAFPHRFAGQFQSEIPTYLIEIQGDYNVELINPELYLDTSVAGGVGVKFGATGEIIVKFEILGGNSPSGTYKIEVAANCFLDVIAALSLEKIDSMIFLQLSFSDLRDFKIEIYDINIPSKFNELILRTVKRILLVSFRKKLVSIPISHKTEAVVVGGWAVETPQLRIIDGPPVPDFDNVTFGFNTFPNAGLGRIQDVGDWINHNNHDFGVAVNQRLLLQSLHRAWQRDQIPKIFDTNGKPNPNGSIRLSDFAFDLRDKTLSVSIQLKTSVAGIPIGTWIHSTATISIVNSELHVSSIEVDLEIPILVNIVGFVLLNIVWLIVREILKNILGSLLERTLRTSLDEFVQTQKILLGFDADIPGTSLHLKAIVDELNITADDIVTSGKVLIT